MHLLISREALALIRREAAISEPEECCGLLLGDSARCAAGAILPAANVAKDRCANFEIDPAVLLRAHRDARAGGPAVIGHYHSHPSGNPYPSDTDAAMAAGQGEVWLIVGRGGEALAWRAARDGNHAVLFQKIEIIQQDESHLA